MSDNLLLNSKTFEIDGINGAGETGIIYCERLIEKWTSQLETEMLDAFIHLYYDEMYRNWGPDDKEESKEYWPEINSPAELVKYTGTNVVLYALENAVYARNTADPSYVLQNVPVCVILELNCPWEKEHGWAAVFIDEKFVKVGLDIVDCVWLD